jgi:bacterioferritin-associated ferredoxin
MIFCSCNVISDRDVREALSSENPPRTPHQVHQRLGCDVKCGRCVRSLKEMIGKEVRSRRDAATPACDAG